MTDPASNRTFRLLVTGWRGATRERHGQAVESAIATRINLPHAIPVIVVHGRCDTGGVDLLAHQWCEQTLLPATPEPHPADWPACSPTCPTTRHRRVNNRGQEYCPAAGHRRNQDMVDLGADYFLGFPHIDDRLGAGGTWDCIHRATRAGIRGEVIPLR